MAQGFTFDGEMMGAMMSAREIYATELIKMAEDGLDFMVMASDNTGTTTKLAEFIKKFPERCVDAGIAEADEVGMAAGVALTGVPVYAQFFGPFGTLRCTDQIHTDVAYNDVPVRIIATHGGLTSGGGPTHNTVLDLAMMRVIPNMTVIAPADAEQCAKVIRASYTYNGPIYIRIARGEEPAVYQTNDYDYVIGKAITAKEGNDITIIGAGIGVSQGILAANLLKKENVDVRVLDMHTIKPLDTQAILKAAKETGRIITVEDHSILGGLGGAVAEVIAESGIQCLFKRHGIPDEFAALGYPDDLYAHYGYNAVGIVKEINDMLKRAKEE
ncbi:MAG: transketolase family protein [Tannerella sp.]|jgi:transketolase|nr:transketolase family protein [Tannerella sp.]